jgi:hypothetical protein
MSKINLSRMDVASLMELRKRITNALSEHRGTLEKQLEAIGDSIYSLGGKIARSGRGSALRGNSDIATCILRSRKVAQAAVLK